VVDKYLITDNSSARLDGLLISFLACAAFFGELLSKEYTKMFVSRKNLPLIHVFPTEAATRLYMLQAFH
jgi:hypothetical protein